MVNLKQITMDNFWEVISLNVKEKQHNWVASNVVSIAESKIDTDEMFPLAIYDDEILIGFLMYEFRDWDGPILFIDRIMIDEKYQGKGYGKTSMKVLMDKTKCVNNYTKVKLSVHEYAIDTIEFYKKLGFYFTGEKMDDELVMELKC